MNNPNKPDGITIKKWFEDGIRYKYDFDICKSSNGWAQCDSSKDASYYGQWANPTTLQVMTYCEGDCALETADTPENFAALIRYIAAYNNEAGHGFKIDCMLRQCIADAFQKLGLDDLLH